LTAVHHGHSQQGASLIVAAINVAFERQLIGAAVCVTPDISNVVPLRLADENKCLACLRKKRRTCPWYKTIMKV
jgi:hypothetical protein